jgi:hypothetical protein
MSSTRSLRGLCEETIKEELLRDVSSVPSVPIYDYESVLRRQLGRVGKWCEMAGSLGVSWSNEWVMRQSPASKYVNTKAEDNMVLKPLPGNSH